MSDRLSDSGTRGGSRVACTPGGRSGKLHARGRGRGSGGPLPRKGSEGTAGGWVRLELLLRAPVGAGVVVDEVGTRVVVVGVDMRFVVGGVDMRGVGGGR